MHIKDCAENNLGSESKGLISAGHGARTSSLEAQFHTAWDRNLAGLEQKSHPHIASPQRGV